MKREERRRELTERLVTAAEKLITANGLGALRARDVAREADCALGGIYTVFEDMDALALQVNARTFRALGGEVAAAVAEHRDGPPVNRLIAMANAYFVYAQNNTTRWQALFDTQLTADDSATPDWYQGAVGQLFEIIAEPVRTLRPDLSEHDVGLLVRGLFASVHGIVLLSVQSRISAVPAPEVPKVMEMMLRAATR